MRPIVRSSPETTVLAAVLGSGLLLTGSRHADAESRVQQQGPVVAVQATTVAERPMPRFLTLTGTLAPNEKAEVAADVAGKERATYVERGALVRAGARSRASIRARRR